MKEKKVIDIYKLIADKYNISITKELIDNLKNTKDYNVPDFFLSDGPVVHQSPLTINTFSDIHHHDYYELMYVKNGEMEYFVDQYTFNLKRGDLLIIPPNVLHKLLDDNEQTCERIVISVTKKYISEISTKNTDLLQIFEEITKSKKYNITIKDDMLVKVENYLEILLDTQFSDKYGDDLLFKIRFAQLFLLINNNYASYEIQVSFKSPLIEKIIKYIDNNYSKTITIIDIANYFNVSSSSISHTFKDETGISIHKYLIKRRMVEVAKLIRESVDLHEVAYTCGFNDYTSFFRTFKKEYLMTPLEYRKNSFNYK